MIAPKPIPQVSNEQLKLDEEYAASLMYDDPPIGTLQRSSIPSYKVDELFPKHYMDRAMPAQNYRSDLPQPTVESSNLNEIKENPCDKWAKLRKEFEGKFPYADERKENENKEWANLHKKSQDIARKYDSILSKYESPCKKPDNTRENQNDEHSRKNFQDRIKKLEGVSDDLLNQYKELSYKYGRTDTNPEETGNKHTYHNIRSKPPHNNESREQNGSI